jgi:hypothetical protein
MLEGLGTRLVEGHSPALVLSMPEASKETNDDEERKELFSLPLIPLMLENQPTTSFSTQKKEL